MDWRTSKPHLLLLSRFLVPSSLDPALFMKFEGVLPESTSAALERLRHDGAIVRAPLRETLEAHLNIAALKDLLKQRGLPVTGPKEHLATRLYEADTTLSEQLVAGIELWQCSAEMRPLVVELCSQLDRARNEHEQECYQFLLDRNYESACKCVESYSKIQVVAIGARAVHAIPTINDDVPFLELIFSCCPKILVDLSANELTPFKVAAAMMHLWGTNRCVKWLPKGIKGSQRLNNETTARMILFAVQHKHELRQYQRSGISHVEILAAFESCPACRKLAKKRYALGAVPELPYEHCTHEMGCRCCLLER